MVLFIHLNVLFIYHNKSGAQLWFSRMGRRFYCALFLFFFLLFAQLLDPLFLALDAGPGPGEALVGLTPAGKRVKRKRQPKNVQQKVQHCTQGEQCVQRPDQGHEEARLEEKQTVLATVFREVFGLDGLTALVAPDTGIFHDRVAVKDQHQAAGELKTKEHVVPRCFV